MAALGRSKAHFKYVTLETIRDRLLARARHVLTEVPISTNPFVEYILTGDYADERRLPDYLLEENHPRIRKAADSVTIVQDEIEQFLPIL
jgi:S-adenosylmethionine-diacylglycerol 3-amino-3-carboxypropyl transferase